LFFAGQGDPCFLQIKAKTMASSVLMAELAALTIAAKDFFFHERA
jgi:hypothetical protein